jgi:HEAT repeat protein
VALSDESWRVREMAAKVAARHRLDSVLAEVEDLQHDDNARVRRAAERALVAIATAGG